MSQKIVAFVGMMGSGKGTCDTYLANKYFYPVYHFGNMVYEEVQRRGLDNVEDEIFVRSDMRAKEGKAVMAKHIVRKIEQDQPEADLILLDGLYSWSEYKFLEEVYGERLVVVGVIADKNIRRQRALDRNDGHRTYTLPQIIAREIDEVENLEKGGPIAFADHFIINNSNLENLYEQLETVHAAVKAN